ncbi:uncharacterized protein BDZ99DRAFT_517216 [Mytilinidion resinicola]|uniref:Uncharacterized protein n=1 Tax=Mytilinidion resinicola TaxID=574789 RepID=A0A6A6YVE5_9PEZI|nr:uncharacterized protein BDZ99DRAFT_517216 [Mytilinidion resinicola]KAF2812912.1 hypothetical protein BDZ99DRAFT_517216 [Mytilinidion resinicola]
MDDISPPSRRTQQADSEAPLPLKRAPNFASCDPKEAPNPLIAYLSLAARAFVGSPGLTPTGPTRFRYHNPLNNRWRAAAGDWDQEMREKTGAIVGMLAERHPDGGPGVDADWVGKVRKAYRMLVLEEE